MTIDAYILHALRQADDGSVSGMELSQRLRISRAAVWARIEELRHLGYEIQASPHHGYRLVSSPNLLHADDLLARLGTTRIVGREIQVFQATTSTNDVVDKLARDGVREGAIVFSESQSKGRGRLGRSWCSAPGRGIWMSVLLRPRLTPQSVTQLTIAAATALIRAIRRQTGLMADVKWPNDILVNGLKVAGILTELSAELDHVKYVVLGIGVNANQEIADFPSELRAVATSLKLSAGRKINRPELAAQILRDLDYDYDRVLTGRFDAVALEWENRCSTLGRHVSIRVGDRLVQGQAETLDNAGALLVRTEHGHLERIIGGDVTVDKTTFPVS